MMKNKKTIIAIGLNTLIVIMEIIGFVLSINNHGRLEIQFYTEDSNLLAMISSLIFIIFMIRNINKKKEKFPRWVNILKYVTTSCLAVTFLVVIFILSPMYGSNGFETMMFHDSMLYHHTLCPIVALISFIFFEDCAPKGRKDYIKAILFTIFYAVITVILNIAHLLEGPYPFLMIYKQPIYMSILWFIIIVGGSYFIAVLVGKLNYLVFKRSK